MVENAKVDPSISRLKRIAEALDVTIVDLFHEESSADVVIRKKDRLRGRFPRSKTEIEILIPRIPDKQMDARLAIIHPGGSSLGDYRHPGEEFGLVIKGVLELMVNGTSYKLTEGDSFYFKSTMNHRFSNPGNEPTEVLWVNHPPSW
jgi:uncharacterized cupin superfamily protein